MQRKMGLFLERFIVTVQNRKGRQKNDALRWS